MMFGWWGNFNETLDELEKSEGIERLRWPWMSSAR